MGCHFLLQCMKVKSESEVAQSCPTVATPWTAAHQAPPSMGFPRQEYWSGVPLPSPTTSHQGNATQNHRELWLHTHCQEDRQQQELARMCRSWPPDIAQLSSVSRVRLFATPWTEASQASLSITNSWSLPKPMSIESVMPSNHLILSSPSHPALSLSQH